MKTHPPKIRPQQVAVAFICSAAFAGGVANHSGLLRGFVAGCFVFSVASLGLFLPRLVWTLLARFRNNPANPDEAQP